MLLGKEQGAPKKGNRPLSRTTLAKKRYANNLRQKIQRAIENNLDHYGIAHQQFMPGPISVANA